MGGYDRFEGRRCPATKISITFFVDIEVLNIFSFNNFFGKNNIFRNNDQKFF